MPLIFTTAQQMGNDNGVKLLVYGSSGIGKTVLACTMPTPVLISAESGALSLKPNNLVRLFGTDNPAVCYNIPIIVVTTIDDLIQVHSWCYSSSEARKFESICIDSLSEVAETVLNNAKRQVKDPRQAYGELLEKMQSVIRSFRDLPGKNVMMSAKMEPMKDEMSGIVKYGPSMPGGKLAVQLPYFFDEVFHMGTTKTPQGVPYRYLRTQADLQYEAKDRSGSLDPMEPPFLANVLAKIRGQ